MLQYFPESHSIMLFCAQTVFFVDNYFLAETCIGLCFRSHTSSIYSVMRLFLAICHETGVLTSLLIQLNEEVSIIIFLILGYEFPLETGCIF